MPVVHSRKYFDSTKGASRGEGGVTADSGGGREGVGVRTSLGL